MKVETREDALLHCFDLWLWLACNPARKFKEDWPGWEENGGYLEHCNCYCPCCHYVYNYVYKRDFEQCQDLCPIKWSDIWCMTGEFGSYCTATTNKERTKWALKIAELALDAL